MDGFDHRSRLMGSLPARTNSHFAMLSHSSAGCLIGVNTQGLLRFSNEKPRPYGRWQTSAWTRMLRGRICHICVLAQTPIGMPDIDVY